MSNLTNRDEFFEELYESLCELNDVFIEHGLPNIEFYNPTDDEIDDDDLSKILESFKDITDIVKQQI